jgi:hypothetical protein
MHALKEFEQITIIGRRWFDRRAGNTYHSVDVIVDGVNVGSNPFEYGYGDGYIQSGFKILQAAGYYPKTDRRTGGGASTDYCEFLSDKMNYREKFVFSVSDVGRKRDL